MKELQELFNHCDREIERMHQAIESDDAKKDSPDVHGLRVGMLFAYEDIQSKLEKRFGWKAFEEPKEKTNDS